MLDVRSGNLHINSYSTREKVQSPTLGLPVKIVLQLGVIYHTHYILKVTSRNILRIKIRTVKIFCFRIPKIGMGHSHIGVLI